MLVCLSCHNGDFSAALRLLRWCRKVTPGQGHSILLVLDPAVSEENMRALIHAAGEVFTVSMVRSPHSVRGWPDGANAMFEAAAKRCSELHQPFLWFEPDCVPLKPEWLTLIAEEYERSGKPILGHIYGCETPGLPSSLVSGIAVYPEDTATKLALPLNCPRAWDVWHAETMVLNGKHTPLIQHFWGQPGLPPTFSEVRTPDSPINTFTLDNIEPGAVLFHRNKDGTAMKIIAKKLGIEWDTVPPLTVVLPFCGMDGHLMVKTLSWMSRLHGRLARTCVLHYDASVDQTVSRVAQECAGRVFERVLVSTYPSPRFPHTGWPAACNVAFAAAARFVDTNIKGSWLWFEADAVAMKPDWLEQIEREYAQCGKLFMGCQIGDFDGLKMGHINGTAVYPPEAMKYFPKAMLNWDYPWDAGMRDEMIHLAHRANHLIQHCGAVIDGCCKPANGPQAHFGTQADVDRLVNPTTVYFHPSKDGTLIDRLFERTNGT